MSQRLDFIKDLCQYYMNFLETDGRKHRYPKRFIELFSNNLLMGINLKKYHKFYKNILKVCINNFQTPIEIKPHTYTISIDTKILNEIQKYIDNLEEFDISAVDINDIDKAHDIIYNSFILPFINNFSIFEENKYQIANNITNNIINSLEQNNLNIKELLYSYFNNFAINDLFKELYELYKNKKILEKQEFYLYLCDLTFNNIKYPLFYIPFELINEKDEKFVINFDYQLYINKKAIAYIVQEYNKKNNNKLICDINNRILYLNNLDSLADELNGLLKKLSILFNLDNNIDLNKLEYQLIKNEYISISNNVYFVLFDKSDETIINDYEEILSILNSDNNIEIKKKFTDLIIDFIENEPKSFNLAIDNIWDSYKINEKLVCCSPIPLNEEQRQILFALNNPECKYIVVEGPPGTGKSHTITAIVCDAILNNKSILVLSDKIEALDVVEDKITSTLNKIRIDKNFRNPILRIGKIGNNYSQILSNSTIDNIKKHYRVTKSENEKLNDEIQILLNKLNEDIENEYNIYKKINKIDFNRYFDLYYKYYLIEIDEILDDLNYITQLRTIFIKLKNILNNNKLFNIFPLKNNTLSELHAYINNLIIINNELNNISNLYPNYIKWFNIFDNLNYTELNNLRQLFNKYQNLRHPIFGYLFKSKEIEQINNKLNYKLNIASRETPKIINMLEYFKNKNINLSFVHIIIKNNLINEMCEIINLKNDLEYLSNIKKYSKFMNSLKLSDDIKSIYYNILANMTEEDYKEFMEYINIYKNIKNNLSKIKYNKYLETKTSLENLIITKMSMHLDEQLINFYENNRATVKVLKNIISAKKKFPRDEFMNLKKAFPCILSGIRDYSDYIPLLPNIFDIIIIDEASQVSIAQALPALIRGKQILILGDTKQFSNVKTSLANKEINNEQLNKIRNSFKTNISNELTKLIKFEKFNIKTSIIEFFEFISNYNIQLIKHFRGFKELISYSNKYFYNNNLQIMKITTKPIDEIIKFSILQHDGLYEKIRNTNTIEANFIIQELLKLKNSNKTVGIITPHTNQQKLLIDMISNLSEKDYLYNELKLKIMTFDTCQGEERDIIFYSMVANPAEDSLNNVFIKNLENINIEENGKIRAQRLNVGFSRAKEQIHFVLSKPIEQYKGAIGDAIRYYYNILVNAQQFTANDVDVNSPMEKYILEWFYQTKFYQNYKDKIIFIPQFPIGEYLKQIDKTYSHPNFVADFLLIFDNNNIIIEYDGLFEHFINIDNINKYNYQNYYKPYDVYRQKILESYGYKFIRLNKFNLGDNPIQTIDKMINNILNINSQTNFSNFIQKKIEELHNGNIKECNKCHKFLPINYFYDSSLVKKYGNVCMICKKKLVLAN